MARNITGTIQTEVNKDAVQPILLMEFNFSTVLRFWTGVGDLTWNSLTWTGSGDVIKLSGLDETSRVEATGITFELAGVDAALMSLALQEDVQGRPVNVWLGFIGAGTVSAITDPTGGATITDPTGGADITDPAGGVAGNVLADPVGPYEYRMDSFSIDDTPPFPRITLKAESYLASLTRARPRRYTHEDQQIEFPGDLGLEYAASIQNKAIRWGA